MAAIFFLIGLFSLGIKWSNLFHFLNSILFSCVSFQFYIINFLLYLTKTNRLNWQYTSYCRCLIWMVFYFAKYDCAMVAITCLIRQSKVFFSFFLVWMWTFSERILMKLEISIFFSLFGMSHLGKVKRLKG